MKKMKLFFTAMMVLMTSVSLFAQDVTVTGVVRDASTGEPVPFASIQIKGTLTGGSTDADGNYSILVADDAVLVFSSIGYQSQEIEVSGRDNINVALQPDSEMLEETVVIGYGSSKKVSSLVGSVQTVNSETIKNAPSSSALDQLQGQVAGLQVLSFSGVAGDNAVSMSLHGVGSLGSSSTPLYVIDGIPSTSRSIMAMNPNDIESISVLKDAAATSIYGNLRLPCRQRCHLRNDQGRLLQRAGICHSACTVRYVHTRRHEPVQEHDDRLRADGLLGQVRNPQRVMGKLQLR